MSASYKQTSISSNSKKSDNLLTLHNIGVKTAEGDRILEHISFNIKPQEVVSLIGPNGAGKSTLIKVILKLIKSSTGHIIYAPHLRIGYVPQKIQWSDSIPYTVKDFLLQTTNKPPKEQSKEDVKKHQNKIMAETGVNGLLNRSIHHLSGGERQRVLIARALMGYPELLILDEPMQGLDLHSEETLYAYLQTLPKEYHCAIFIVSHDIHWVLQGTERVICLNHHICCSGTPQQVQDDLAYQALFGHRVYYHHQHDRCLHHKIGNTPPAPLVPVTAKPVLPQKTSFIPYSAKENEHA